MFGLFLGYLNSFGDLGGLGGHTSLNIATGESLDRPETGNVRKMSRKCPKIVQQWYGGTENTIF